MKIIRGFTLVEVVTVLTIIATLILIAKPAYDNYQKELLQTEVKLKLMQLADVGVQFKTQNNGSFADFTAFDISEWTPMDFPIENPQYKITYTSSPTNANFSHDTHFVFTAKPIKGKTMDGDGMFCIDENQRTLWVKGEIADGQSCLPTETSNWD